MGRGEEFGGGGGEGAVEKAHILKPLSAYHPSSPTKHAQGNFSLCRQTQMACTGEKISVFEWNCKSKRETVSGRSRVICGLRRQYIGYVPRLITS